MCNCSNLHFSLCPIQNCAKDKVACVLKCSKHTHHMAALLCRVIFYFVRIMICESFLVLCARIQGAYVSLKVAELTDNRARGQRTII